MKHFRTPVVPGHFAVIFTSQQSEQTDGYEEMAARMVELAKEQPGYVGLESVRDGDGFGITISYWEDEQSIRDWKRHTEHADAQRRGKSRWYRDYTLRVSRVERVT